MTPPTLEEFLSHGLYRCEIEGLDPEKCRRRIINKFGYWEDGDWEDGNGKPIQNWKRKLTTAIGYWRAEDFKVNEPKVIQADFLKKRYGTG
ncbi:hypothetical protein [Flagellimonas sp. SN16]|uniref:hypothetical protein n=1 Tax=Flagellimonas sp. SN16 TaxID=3415142 RepID=UPI003C4BABC9